MVNAVDPSQMIAQQSQTGIKKAVSVSDVTESGGGRSQFYDDNNHRFSANNPPRVGAEDFRQITSAMNDMISSDNTQQTAMARPQMQPTQQQRFQQPNQQQMVRNPRPQQPPSQQQQAAPPRQGYVGTGNRAMNAQMQPRGGPPPQQHQQRMPMRAAAPPAQQQPQQPPRQQAPPPQHQPHTQQNEQQGGIMGGFFGGLKNVVKDVASNDLVTTLKDGTGDVVGQLKHAVDTTTPKQPTQPETIPPEVALLGKVHKEQPVVPFHQQQHPQQQQELLQKVPNAGPNSGPRFQQSGGQPTQQNARMVAPSGPRSQQPQPRPQQQQQHPGQRMPTNTTNRGGMNSGPGRGGPPGAGRGAVPPVGAGPVIMDQEDTISDVVGDTASEDSSYSSTPQKAAELRQQMGDQQATPKIRPGSKEHMEIMNQTSPKMQPKQRPVGIQQQQQQQQQQPQPQKQQQQQQPQKQQPQQSQQQQPQPAPPSYSNEPSSGGFDYTSRYQQKVAGRGQQQQQQQQQQTTQPQQQTKQTMSSNVPQDQALTIDTGNFTPTNNRTPIATPQQQQTPLGNNQSQGRGRATAVGRAQNLSQEPIGGPVAQKPLSSTVAPQQTNKSTNQLPQFDNASEEMNLTKPKIQPERSTGNSAVDTPMSFAMPKNPINVANQKPGISEQPANMSSGANNLSSKPSQALSKTSSGALDQGACGQDLSVTKRKPRVCDVSVGAPLLPSFSPIPRQPSEELEGVLNLSSGKRRDYNSMDNLDLMVVSEEVKQIGKFIEDFVKRVFEEGYFFR